MCLWVGHGSDHAPDDDPVRRPEGGHLLVGNVLDFDDELLYVLHLPRLDKWRVLG